MKITDEMVQRASLAFRDSEGEVNPACGYWSCLRNALEAVFADIPDQSERIAELEAKLEEARVLAQVLPDDVAPHRAELLRILGQGAAE